MKRFSAIVALLLLAQVTDAKPWYKDWKAWTVVGVSIGASAAATHWGHQCRVQFGPAPCLGGYGSFVAREAGVRLGLAGGLTALSLWGRQEGYKEWAAFPLGFAAFNAGVAIKQSTVGCPAGQEFVYGTKRCHIDDELRK